MDLSNFRFPGWPWDAVGIEASSQVARRGFLSICDAKLCQV